MRETKLKPYVLSGPDFSLQKILIRIDGLESDKSGTWLMLRFRIVDIFYLSIINYIFITNPSYYLLSAITMHIMEGCLI